MKKGFTLVELLGVIVILSLLAVLTFPSILNFIKKGNDYIDESTEKLIYSAAKTYIKDNQDNYPKKDNRTYCISLSDLIDSNNIKESMLSNDLIENKTVKVIYKNKYNYSVVDKDQCIVPQNFSTDSWVTIAQAFKDGSYENIYNIGDTKEVDMGEFGTHTVRISNLSTPEECNQEGYSQTACGVVIEFVDIITTHEMNPAGTYGDTYYQYGTNIGGYPSSKMHEYIENAIYPALPKELRDVIIETYTVSSHGYEDTDNFKTKEKLYLLDVKELYGTSWANSYCGRNYDSTVNLTRQLDYYNQKGVTYNNNFSSTYKKLNGVGKYWWLRSIETQRSVHFMFIYDKTYNVNSTYAYNEGIGVSPAFRLATE